MSQLIAYATPLARTYSLPTAIPLAALAGRILLSAIFIIAGIMKLANWQGTAEYMASKEMPLIPVLLPAAAFVEIVGGLSLLLGLDLLAVKSTTARADDYWDGFTGSAAW
jgi:putative oxidoreductase